MIARTAMSLRALFIRHSYRSQIQGKRDEKKKKNAETKLFKLSNY